MDMMSGRRVARRKGRARSVRKDFDLMGEEIGEMQWDVAESEVGDNLASTQLSQRDNPFPPR